MISGSIPALQKDTPAGLQSARGQKTTLDTGKMPSSTANVNSTSALQPIKLIGSLSNFDPTRLYNPSRQGAGDRKFREQQYADWLLGTAISASSGSTWTAVKIEPPKRPAPSQRFSDAPQKVLTRLPRRYLLALIRATYGRAGVPLKRIEDAPYRLDLASADELARAEDPLVCLELDAISDLGRLHPDAPLIWEALCDLCEPLSEHIEDIHLIGYDEEQLRKRAAEIARHYRELEQEAYLEHGRRLERGETAYPYQPRYSARQMCPEAQLRHLRKRFHEVDGHISWILGQTGRRQKFVANQTLELWRERQAKGQEWCARTAIINSTTHENIGTVAAIKATAETARRATLITMVYGMQERAARDGLRCYFLTLTLPPEYHPNPSKGRSSYNPAVSPRDAAAEMQQRWKRARAIMFKHSAQVYGVWTSEPHADGCPHRHAAIWCAEADAEEIERALRQHFRGEHALEFRNVTDSGDARITSYVLTYVLKATNQPAAQTSDAAEEDHHADFERFRSWASSLNIRRYGLIGLQPGAVKLWQKVFNAPKREIRRCRTLMQAQKAMKRGQYATAIQHLGILNEKASRVFESVHDVKVNRYNEEYKIGIGFHCLPERFDYIYKSDDYELFTCDDRAVVVVTVNYPRDGAAHHPNQPKPPPDGVEAQPPD